MTKASMRSARRSNGLRPKTRPICQQRGSNVNVSITTPLSANDSYVLATIVGHRISGIESRLTLHAKAGSHQNRESRSAK
jgi:hypothetical protein